MEAVMVVEVLSGHHRVRTRLSLRGGRRRGALHRRPQRGLRRGARRSVRRRGPCSDQRRRRGPRHGHRSREHQRHRDRRPATGTAGAGRARTAACFASASTRLRVRTAREVVAPEQADRGGSAGWSRGTELKVLAAGSAVSIAATVFEVWTSTTRSRESCRPRSSRRCSPCSVSRGCGSRCGRSRAGSPSASLGGALMR